MLQLTSYYSYYSYYSYFNYFNYHSYYSYNRIVLYYQALLPASIDFSFWKYLILLWFITIMIDL